MKKIYHLLFLTLSFLNVNAQEQLTHFDNVYYNIKNSNLVFLIEKADALYFQKGFEIVKYNLEADSLVSVMTLPLKVGYYTFSVINDEIYACDIVSNTGEDKNKYSFLYLDLEKNRTVEVATLYGGIYPFITSNGVFVSNNSNVFRHSFDKDKSIKTDTLFNSVSKHFGINSNYYYVAGLESTTREEIHGVINNAGEFMKFPNFTEGDISSITTIDNTFLIFLDVNQNGKILKKELILEDGTFKNKEVGGYRTEYYKNGNVLIEADFVSKGGIRIDEVVIYHYLGEKRVKIAEVPVNTFREYYSVYFMSSPSTYRYSNSVVVEDHLYFLGNDVVKSGDYLGEESNFKLFKINLMTGEREVFDANVLLNSDLYMYTYLLGVKGFKLERDEQNNIIVYPNRRDFTVKHKTYTFDLASKSFVELDTYYDPRYFVETKSGYYNKVTGMLLNKSKEYFKEVPVNSVFTEKKSSESFVTIQGEKVIETDDVLYFIHKDKNKFVVTTYTGNGPAKTQDIFDNFIRLTNIEAIKCGNNYLLGIHGRPDTLDLEGIYFYSFNLESQELKYLGISSNHIFYGLGNPRVREINGRYEFFGDSYFIQTDFEKSTLLSHTKMVHELNNSEVVLLRNGNLIRINKEGSKSEVIASHVYRKLNVGGHLYFLTEEGLVTMNSKGELRTILKGKPGYRTYLNKLSEKEFFFALDNKSYLFDVSKNIYENLQIEGIETRTYSVAKNGETLVLNEEFGYDKNETYFTIYDLKNHKSTYARAPYEASVLFSPEAHTFWILVFKYEYLGQDADNYTYTVKRLSGEKTTDIFQIKTNKAIYFRESKSMYLKSSLDNAIYYFNADNYSFTKVLVDYSKLGDVIHQGKKKDILQVFKNENSNSYDIVEVDKENNVVQILRRNIRKQLKPMFSEESFYFLESDAPTLDLYYSSKYGEELNQEYSHKESSKIEVYNRFLPFRNNIYTLAFSEEQAYQLYKLSNQETKNVLENVEQPLGNESSLLKFSFYPNPTSEILNISTSAENNEKFKIRVFDTSGKLLDELISAFPAKVNFSGYQTGVYLIHVSGAGQNTAYRIIKK